MVTKHDAVHKERSINIKTEQPGATQNKENINSENELRKRIINVIIPMTKETSEAIDNS